MYQMINVSRGQIKFDYINLMVSIFRGKLQSINFLISLFPLSFSGTSPNQNFVKKPEVQDLGLSSSAAVDSITSSSAAATADRRTGQRLQQLLLALILLAATASSANMHWKEEQVDGGEEEVSENEFDQRTKWKRKREKPLIPGLPICG